MDELTLREQIIRGHFDSKLDYPPRPRKPLLHRNHTSQDAANYAVLLKDYEKELVEQKAKLGAYGMDQQRLMNEFKQKAFEHCGIEDHPKRETAWNMAWENGHSAGLASVLDHLEELSDLLI